MAILPPLPVVLFGSCVSCCMKASALCRISMASAEAGAEVSVFLSTSSEGIHFLEGGIQRNPENHHPNATSVVRVLLVDEREATSLTTPFLSGHLHCLRKQTPLVSCVQRHVL